jgi:hypothetical protein
MTDNAGLEQRLADHYAREAPPRAPDRVLQETLAAVETTRQRAAFGRIPGRIGVMSNLAKVAVAAVILIALGAFGIALLRSSTATGPGSSPGSSTQSSLLPSSGPGSSAAPALTKSFSSSFNGFSISYPGDWRVISAKRSWPTGSPNFNPDDPAVDSLSGPNLAIYAVSQKIAAGTTPTQWLDKYMSDSRLDFSNRPDCAVEKTLPIVVDGAAGVMIYSCEAVLIDAVVTAGGRAYVFSLQGDSPDKAFLLEVLKTVQLHPESAVDVAPSSSPSVGPSTGP